MHEHHLKRIMSLVTKTGDRAVVADPDFDEPFVLMDVESYEALWDEANYQGFPQGVDEQRELNRVFPIVPEKNGFVEQKIVQKEEQKPQEKTEDKTHLTEQKTSDIIKPAVIGEELKGFNPKPVPHAGGNMPAAEPPAEFLPEPI